MKRAVIAIIITFLLIAAVFTPVSFCIQSSSVTIGGNEIHASNPSQLPIYLYKDESCIEKWNTSAFTSGIISCYKSSDDTYKVSNTMISMLGTNEAFIKVDSTEETFSLNISSTYTAGTTGTNNILNKVTIIITPINGVAISKSVTDWNSAMLGVTFEELSTANIYSVDILVGYNGSNTISNLEKIFLDINFKADDGVQSGSIINNNNEIQFSESSNNIGGISLPNNNTKYDMDIVDNPAGISNLPSGTEAAVIKDKESTSGSFTKGNNSASTTITSNGNNPFMIYLYIPEKNGNSSATYIVSIQEKGASKPINLPTITKTGYIGYDKTTGAISFNSDYNELNPLNGEYTISINGDPHSGAPDMAISLYVLFKVN